MRTAVVLLVLIGAGTSGLGQRDRPDTLVAGRVSDGNGRGIFATVVPYVLGYDRKGATALRPAPVSRRFSPVDALLTRLGIENPVRPPDVENPPRYTTDDRGEFRIAGLDPGFYIFYFDMGARSLYFPGTNEPDQAAILEIKAGEPRFLRDVVVSSAATSMLRVRVDDGTGLFLTTAAIAIRRRDGVERLLSQAISFNRATEVGRLEPGFYDLEVIAGGVAGSALAGTFVPFHVDEKDITLSVTVPAPVPLRGRTLIDRGGGVYGPGARLKWILSSKQFAPHLRFVVVTDGEGFVTPTVFPSGLYRLESVVGIADGGCVQRLEQGTQDVQESGIEVVPDMAPVNVILHETSSTVLGTLGGSDGSPVPGAVIVLLSPDSADYAVATTDSRGAFEFTCVIGGNYRLVAVRHLEGLNPQRPEFLEKFRGRGYEIQLGVGQRLRLPPIRLEQ